MGETPMQELVRRGRWAPGREARDVELVQETRGAEPPLPRRRPHRSVTLPVFSLLLFTSLLYAAWELISLAHVVPDFILPTPLQVAQDFGLELSRGDLLANAGVTLQEALGGFALAGVVAGVLGYAIARLRPLEVLVAPFIAASQAIPVVAVAPIIILLLGAGLLPKVLIGAVVVVFPLLITVVTGLRGVGRDYHDVARVFGASRLQTLLLVELPLAAPTLLSGLKLGLTLSIMGAVVGEFVAADSGLGFMISNAVGNFEVSTRYVALIALAIFSIALFGLVTLLERMLLRWQDS
jgi:NitT/TauT family transport system permease protein